jgi:uncharacterized protein YlxW (UPF0749 family)
MSEIRPDQQLPDRVTMPLLSLITQQSLDEDYLHVAERRAAGASEPARGRPHRIAAVVIVVFGILVTTAAVQTSRNAGVDSAGRATLISQIVDERTSVSDMQDDIVRLRERNVGLSSRLSQLTLTEQASASRLHRLEAVTGFVPVTGEGVKIVVDDAPNGDETQSVRDEDLAILVDGLWNAGAEAIAINGQRLTVLSAIRNVNVAIHVNSRPLSPPYTVLAIGDTQTLQANLLSSTHGQEWFSLVDQLGFVFDMQNEESLSLPAARMRPRSSRRATS